MRSQGKIIPVLMGGDLNAYSVALAFREAYGIVSHAFTRYRCGATENSKFIKTHICPGFSDIKIAIPELLKFAAENSSAELFLIPCADWYVSMLEDASSALSGLYHIYIPPKHIWERLSDKCGFYEEAKKADIPYPEYVSFKAGEKIADKKITDIPYPAVLKPSDSTEYWNNPFPNMRKVYFPEDRCEAEKLIDKIFNSGYNKRILLQRKIGSNYTNKVLTTFSDRNGRVVRCVYGDVVLEEIGKTSFGNHSAIITVSPDEICFRLIDYLNSIKYCGFANFDIMSEENRKYVLEINMRQGRSCDYLRAAGVNIAELLVRNARGENIEPDFSYNKIYWHYPPHKTVVKYSDAKNAERVKRLANEGKDYTPYGNSLEGIKRRLYVMVHNIRLASSIKSNYEGNTV